MTSGPVMNIFEVSLTMTVKSVRAGEYADPPAQGPRMSEIWGITPEERVFKRKIFPYPFSDATPS